MNGFFLSFSRWPVTGLRGLVLGWLVAEVLAFCVAIKLLGLGGTLLLGLCTTLLGAAMLRRLGLDAARQLSRTFVSGSRNEDFVDGTLTALGALLLIVPGFVSDAVGLALATPSVRQRVAARLLTAPDASGPGPRRRSNPDIIDLSPDDWRVVDRTGRV